MKFSNQRISSDQYWLGQISTAEEERSNWWTLAIQERGEGGREIYLEIHSSHHSKIATIITKSCYNKIVRTLKLRKMMAGNTTSLPVLTICDWPHIPYAFINYERLHHLISTKMRASCMNILYMIVLLLMIPTLEINCQPMKMNRSRVMTANYIIF